MYVIYLFAIDEHVSPSTLQIQGKSLDPLSLTTTRYIYVYFTAAIRFLFSEDSPNRNVP